jgi:hypothetical protein
MTCANELRVVPAKAGLYQELHVCSSPALLLHLHKLNRNLCILTVWLRIALSNFTYISVEQP